MRLNPISVSFLAMRLALLSTHCSIVHSVLSSMYVCDVGRKKKFHIDAIEMASFVQHNDRLAETRELGMQYIPAS